MMDLDNSAVILRPMHRSATKVLGNCLAQCHILIDGGPGLFTRGVAVDRTTHTSTRVFIFQISEDEKKPQSTFCGEN